MLALKLFAVLTLCFSAILAVGVESSQIGATQDTSQNDDFLYDTFPEGFRWGFATASYQIEGGYEEDGKGHSIWDEFTHRTPSPIFNGGTGDVACDSYHKYPEDVKLLKDVGANFYRFSIAWTRIIPDGTSRIVNEPGVDYYNKLIDLLLENNITPMVTIYHWDLPQDLQNPGGGWPNEDLIVYYQNYARVLFERFGDRVKHWITFNEPYNSCELGYGVGIAAPGLRQEATAPYKCAHTILKAHAKVYHMYNDEFKPTQGGEVGIVIESEWMQPSDPNNEEHVKAAERALRFKHGWFAFPVVFGDYSPEMREYIDAASKQEGRTESRLPTFDEDWKKLLKGSLDFLGVNHYSTDLINPGKELFCTVIRSGWWCDQAVRKNKDAGWDGSAAEWLKKVPWGLRKLLNWIKDTYGNPKVYITENGWTDAAADGTDDTKRISYHREYINNVLKAIKVDGCNVQAYTAWSLLDNFEWANGYRNRFGVVWVDFEDDERTRVPKQSYSYFQQLIKDNGFPFREGPTTTPPTTTTVALASSFNVQVSLIISLFLFVLFRQW